MNETKEYWRRRALKAEKQLEQLERIRIFEHNQEFSLSHTNAALTTAFLEIERVIEWARNCEKTIGR